MIAVTRLNGSVVYVNPHQIEFMEQTPDTVIRMFSEKQIIVKETCSEILEKVVQYRMKIGVKNGNEAFW